MSPAPHHPESPFRKDVVVDHAKVGGVAHAAPLLTLDLDDDPDLAAHARPDLTDLRVHAADGTPVPFEVEASDAGVLLDDAMTLWFNIPSAVCVRHGDVERLVATGQRSDGSCVIASLDLATHEVASFVLAERFFQDDHAMPEVAVRPDGRLVAMWTKHAQEDTTIHYRIGSDPADVRSWGPEHTLQATGTGTRLAYPKIFFLPGEADRCYLVHRAPGSQQAVRWSDDLATVAPGTAATWSAQLDVYGGGEGKNPPRPYFQVESDGDRTLHFTCGEGHPRDLDTSLYHWSYVAGTFRRSDGTTIKAVSDQDWSIDPPAQATPIWSFADRGGQDAWAWDLALDPATGRPSVAFSTYPPTEPINQDHRAQVARFTGTEWRVAEVCSMGQSIIARPSFLPYAASLENQYSGGIAISREDPDVCFIGRQRPGLYAWELTRWRTDDDGASWRLERTITPNTQRKNTKPTTPRGRGALTRPCPEVLFTQSDYITYDADDGAAHYAGSLVVHPAPAGLPVQKQVRFRPPHVAGDRDTVLRLAYGDPHATDRSVPQRGTGDTLEAQFLPHVFRGGTWAQTPELDLAGLPAFECSCVFRSAGEPRDEDQVLFSCFDGGETGRSAGFLLGHRAGVVSALVVVAGDAQVGGVFAGPSIADGVERQVRLTYDPAGGLRLLLDGVPSPTTFPYGGPLAPVSGVGRTEARIGASGHTPKVDRHLVGTLRDLRVHAVVEGDAWATLQRHAAIGDLLRVGPEVRCGDGCGR